MMTKEKMGFFRTVWQYFRLKDNIISNLVDCRHKLAIYRNSLNLKICRLEQNSIYVIIIPEADKDTICYLHEEIEKLQTPWTKPPILITNRDIRLLSGEEKEELIQEIKKQRSVKP